MCLWPCRSDTRWLPNKCIHFIFYLIDRYNLSETIRLCITLHPFGTLYLLLLHVPLPLMPSRAARGLVYLMWHIPRSNDFYFLCCLWFFSVLAATKQLLRTLLSVRLSVCHTLFTIFLSSHHHEIFWSYYHWQKWRPCKRSRSKVKGEGHRGHDPI